MSEINEKLPSTLLALSASEFDSTASCRLLEPSVIAPLSCILFELPSTTSGGSSEMHAHFEPEALGAGNVGPFGLGLVQCMSPPLFHQARQKAAMGLSWRSSPSPKSEHKRVCSRSNLCHQMLLFSFI